MSLHTFVYLYFFNLLPSISRCVAQPRDALVKLMDPSVRLAAWTGVFGAALVTVLAPQILGLFYSQSYVGGAPSFSILIWMLPVAMLSGHHRYILIAYNHQKRLFLCTALAAAAAVVFGLILVPLYGGPGAAWALLIAITVNFALAYISVRQLVFEVPVHRQMAGPLAALGVAAVLYGLLRSWNTGFAIAAASAVYVGFLLYADGAGLLAFLQVVFRRTATPVGSVS
jgi:O-antigen/teichoic acid export membrane protein